MNWNKVLLVEDDDDDQAFFRMALKELNPELECAIVSNGLEALEALSDSDPGIIFLDLNMPRMNGFDFLQAYRKDNSAVPVVILTTSGDKRDIEKANELGAQGFITKPTDYGNLKNILSDVMSFDFKGAQNAIRIF